MRNEMQKTVRRSKSCQALIVGRPSSTTHWVETEFHKEDSLPSRLWSYIDRRPIYQVRVLKWSFKKDS